MAKYEHYIVYEVYGEKRCTGTIIYQTPSFRLTQDDLNTIEKEAATRVGVGTNNIAITFFKRLG